MHIYLYIQQHKSNAYYYICDAQFLKYWKCLRRILRLQYLHSKVTIMKYFYWLPIIRRHIYENLSKSDPWPDSRGRQYK